MKSTITILVSLLFLCIGAKNLNAQENANPQKDQTNYKHAIGIGAGFTTGYGLSYRYQPKKLGVQVNFAPYKDDYETIISFGVTFLYKLVETEKTNLFLYQGNHYYHNEYNSGGGCCDWSYKDNYLNVGVGIGIEFMILKRVSFNLMCGYAGLENFDQIGFTGETGLYFKL